MKRSEINQIMREAVNILHEYKITLPPFGYWTPKDWSNKGREYDEIRDNMLGWDITDFGSRDYNTTGLLMFTLRNGNFTDNKYKKPYAEKVLITKENQKTPFHFHWSKMEDIINRAGGNLIVECWNSDEQGNTVDTPVTLHIDGRRYTEKPGKAVCLSPGESISLVPYQYHSFWAEEGSGTVVLGEVSTVNNDNVDNRFLDSVGRFPEIDEDEPPLFYLCNEYAGT